jgi:hypothetical protein
MGSKFQKNSYKHPADGFLLKYACINDLYLKFICPKLFLTKISNLFYKRKLKQIINSHANFN